MSEHSKSGSCEVKAVILDWAGTAVDYGSMAPLAVFIEIFRRRGVDITLEEAREPMGVSKRDHVQALCDMERISREWEKIFGERPSEEDVNRLYADFETMLFSILEQYSEPVPGLLETVQELRNNGIKIGSTTGYTSEMMEIVTSGAAKLGYAPDCVVSPSDVPAGRPFPWMCYLNAIRLQVYPLEALVKVGDTLSDIREGLNAGMWSVGLLFGGSEVGYTLEEFHSSNASERQDRANRARQRFLDTGAHYVVETVRDIPAVIDSINRRLAAGDRPVPCPLED